MLIFAVCVAVCFVCSFTLYRHVSDSNVTVNRRVDYMLTRMDGAATTTRHHMTRFQPDPRKQKLNTGFQCTTLIGVNKNGTICVYFPEVDRYISPYLIRIGAWEPRLTHHFQLLLQYNPDLNVIDIGANLGVYSILGALLGRKVIAVEPFYSNMVRLHAAVRLNAFNEHQDMVKLLYNAVSNQRAVVNITLDTADQNTGHAHIDSMQNAGLENYATVKKANEAQTLIVEQVDAVYMDDLLEVIDFKHALLKIDVEGFEVKAFQRADKLFDTVDITHVFMEWMWVKSLPGVHGLMQFFLKRRYRPYSPRDGMYLYGDIQDWPVDVVWVKPH